MLRLLAAAVLRLYPVEFRRLAGPEVLDTLMERTSERRQSAGVILASIHAVKEISALIAGVAGARRFDTRGKSSATDRVWSRHRRIEHNTYRDVLFAIRDFAKHPGYAAIVILTLGIGIGANTAIFSVVNGVLLRPLPYENPEQLALIWGRFDWLDTRQTWVHDLQVRALREQAESFQGFAAMQMVSGRILGGDRPVHTDVARVSYNFFDLLGVNPIIGRTFKEGDDVWPTPWVVLLTHDYWTREFGQDPDILGKKIVVGYPDMEIIGVLPKDFDYRMYEALGERTRPDLWIPHQIDYNWWSEPQPGMGVAVLGRVKDGVSFEQAAADLQRVAGLQDAQFFDNSGFTFEMVPLLSDIVAEVRPVLLLLIFAVGFVLAIASANITTLVLARTQFRETELAVRMSLGGSRLRIARQLLTENLTLAFVGGGVGLLLSYLGTDLLLALAPTELPRMDAIGVDLRVLAFTGFITVACGVASGIAPTLQTQRADSANTLHDAGRGGVDVGRSRRIRNTMVVLEFALSVVLLAGAGLMLRSFVRLQQVDPGFRSDAVLTFSVYLMEEYPELDGRHRFFTELTRRVEKLPGVREVGGTSALPLSAPAFAPVFRNEQPFEINFTVLPGKGVDPNPGILIDDDWTMADINTAHPGYFNATGIGLVAGREFTDADSGSVKSVAVIDEKLARTLWPGESAIGKRFWFGSWRDVVGVARHTQHHGLGSDDGRPQIYYPYAQIKSGRVSMVVHTYIDPTSLVPAIREQVRELDANVPIADIRTMEDIVGEAVAQRRFTTTLMTIFAGAAVLLAAIGIYGVLSFSVSQRRREIAVRMAVGSSGQHVARMVIGEGLRLALIGSALGLGAALALGSAVEAMLFDVRSDDPLTLGLAAALIAGVAVLACWLPARRATAVDPAGVLRG